MVNFYEEVDRNFGMKFLREEVTDGGAVDGAWIWDVAYGFRYVKLLALRSMPGNAFSIWKTPNFAI